VCFSPFCACVARAFVELLCSEGGSVGAWPPADAALVAYLGDLLLEVPGERVSAAEVFAGVEDDLFVFAFVYCGFDRSRERAAFAVEVEVPASLEVGVEAARLDCLVGGFFLPLIYTWPL
jgi:hypothetical protein